MRTGTYFTGSFFVVVWLGVCAPFLAPYGCTQLALMAISENATLITIDISNENGEIVEAMEGRGLLCIAKTCECRTRRMYIYDYYRGHFVARDVQEVFSRNRELL